MNPQDSELIQKAEYLENEAKTALKEKNYDKAVSNLLVAKDIYTRLGLSGQVGILIREIVRIKNLRKENNQSTDLKQITEFKIELHPKEPSDKDQDITQEKGFELLETARTQVLEDNIKDALYFYDVAYKIFEKLNQDYECKQILWQINELKEYQRWGESHRKRGIKPALKDIVALAKAEKRRLKIQSQLDDSKKSIVKTEKSIEEPQKKEERKMPKIFAEMRKSEIEERKVQAQAKNLIEIQQEQRKHELYEREKKIKQLKEQKKKEDAQLAQAQDLLGKGKEMLEKKKYEEAKKFYTESIELFTLLGWNNQVSILQNELRNIDRYKKEDQIRHQQALLSKVESEKQFQQTVSKALGEQKRIEQIEREKLSALPIEVKSTLEKIDLLKSKADKEENMDNFSRAIARYEYILTLYNSISREIINLSEEISSIEQKIEELKAKL